MTTTLANGLSLSYYHQVAPTAQPVVRIPTRTVRLSFTSAPLDDKKLGVPLPICLAWRNTLESAALTNIQEDCFGPQRLTLKAGELSYKIMYRIDLSPSMLQTIATRPYGGTLDDHREVPTLEEALCDSTQIWVTFEETASDDALTSYCCKVISHLHYFCSNFVLTKFTTRRA